MMCCTRYCAAEALFNSKVAKRDLRRYRRRGADATTRLMLAEIRRLPLEGQHLMDVGGGIGVITCELADTRVASATVVEASPSYLEVARREVGGIMKAVLGTPGVRRLAANPLLLRTLARLPFVSADVASVEALLTLLFPFLQSLFCEIGAIVGVPTPFTDALHGLSRLAERVRRAP